MNYQEWEETVPGEITGDPLWRMKSYRLSLLLADLAWNDCARMQRDPRMRSLTAQLYRSVGSIGANIAEGYSRSSGRDQARFYEYALGSVRESQDWYYKSRQRLSPEVIDHRLKLLTEVRKLLLKTVVSQRQHKLREPDEEYIAEQILKDQAQPADSSTELDELLAHTPTSD